MNIQNNQRKPFKNPSIAMKHGVFSNIPEKTNFSEKDELFLKYAQKTIFPQKYYKFVDFGFGWYMSSFIYVYMNISSYECIYIYIYVDIYI